MIGDDAAALTVGGEDGARRTVKTLAEALIVAERTISESRPERVQLADDSDLALAAALAAAKLDLPVSATAAALAAPTTNGRLIARLAAERGA